MKPQSFFHRTRALVAMGLSAGIMLAPAANANVSLPIEENPASKTKPKTKASTSRNNNSVKIYPDIVKRTMHVVARENKGKEIDFFVFDLQGTLIQNFKMKERDHQKLSDLARGKYIYRVFSGDVETASGEFEMR